MTGLGTIMILLAIIINVAIAAAGIIYSKSKLATHEGFFTAGRQISVAFMTATFVAFAVGTGLVFSPGESAYYDGLTAMIGYGIAISAAYLVFIPFTKRIKELIPEGHTIGEYVKVRYGYFMYIVTLCVTAIYMFVLLSVNIIGASIMFRFIGGVPPLLGVLVIGVPIIVYTMYGGLGAAVITNAIQAICLVPLLFITCYSAIGRVGGASGIFEGIMAQNPDFLKIFYSSGFQFAIMIIIAVCAAELMNQALWQRVYAAKDHAVVKKALLSSAVMVFPMTIIAASLGLIAVSMGMELPHPSIASVLVIYEVLPIWATLAFSVVVVLAATSTGADGLSAFSSIISLDIIKSFFPDMTPKTAVLIGRIGILVVGCGGMVVGYFAPSVLFTLLLADLLASAAVIPVLFGLYSSKISGTVAAIATIAGIIAGLPQFIAGATLWSFLLALIVSSLVLFVGSRLFPTDYDFARLKTEIEELQ